MSDIGGLQLLPSQKRKFSLHMGGGNSLLIVAIICFLALGGAYGVIQYLISETQSEITTVEADIMSIHQARDKASEERLATLQKQLAAAGKLLQSHARWSDTITRIAQSVLPEIRFKSLTTNATQKTYSFQATANSYASVAKQIAALYATDAVRELTLNKVSVGSHGAIEFTVDLTLKP